MRSKEQTTEIVAQLRAAANGQDHAARAAIKLIDLIVQDLKESLVRAEGEDMLRLQGAARHFSKLHKELTTEPPNIINQEHTA